jgi:hypothetical protein
MTMVRQRPGALLTDTPGGAERARVLALFEEARRRARLRRLLSAAISLILVAVAAWGLLAGWPHHGAALVRRGNAAQSGAIPAFSLPPATVAWVDYSGEMHVGDVATRAQHVVATVPGLAGTGHMLLADGRLYAVGSAAISQVDMATGAVRPLLRGDAVFASPDGQQLFVTRGSVTLLELPASGSGEPRRLSLPAGWYVEPPDQAVAAGIVVDGPHPGGSGPGQPSMLAIWNPGTGSVKVISRVGSTVVGTYTPPGARYSLIAWQATGCPSGNCPIEITNTSSMSMVKVRSPLDHGFIISGGAFSPDGTKLAVFARTASISPLRANRSELGLADTRTGTIRLVPGAQLDTTEDAAWALWLPGGDRLLAGALNYSYAIDASTAAARPFFFLPGGSDHDIMDTPDINFSAALLPAPAG